VLILQEVQGRIAELRAETRAMSAAEQAALADRDAALAMRAAVQADIQQGNTGRSSQQCACSDIILFCVVVSQCPHP
jgi:hypothetical protein